MYDDDDYEDELGPQLMMGAADVLTHEDRLGARAMQVTQIIAARSELKIDEAGDEALFAVINLLVDDMKAIAATTHAPLMKVPGFTAQH